MPDQIRTNLRRSCLTPIIIIVALLLGGALALFVPFWVRATRAQALAWQVAQRLGATDNDRLANTQSCYFLGCTAFVAFLTDRSASEIEAMLEAIEPGIRKAGHSSAFVFSQINGDSPHRLTVDGSEYVWRLEQYPNGESWSPRSLGERGAEIGWYGFPQDRADYRLDGQPLTRNIVCIRIRIW